MITIDKFVHLLNICESKLFELQLIVFLLDEILKNAFNVNISSLSQSVCFIQVGWRMFILKVVCTEEQNRHEKRQ